MSYQILRVAKLRKIGNIAGSLHHTFRSIDTPNADPSRTHLNQNTYLDTQQALNAIKERLPSQRRHDNVLCLEYLITASPEWSGWRKAEQDKYFEQATNWLKEKHGADNVVMTGIQLDETTPHMVAYVVPLVNGRLSAKTFTGGRKVLSDMQTDFHDKVARNFNFERGLAGSRSTHQSIKKFYAKIEKLQKDMEDLNKFQLPEPVKGKFGFGGESLDEYKIRVDEVVNNAITTLSEALISNDVELDKLSAKISLLEKETASYRKSLHKVGLGQVEEFNQKVDDLAKNLADERKLKFKSDNLKLLTVHDNTRFRSDTKIKFIDNEPIGKVITDKDRYLRQVADILTKAEIETPSPDVIEKYAFARKFLNTLSDMEQSGELMTRVRANNEAYNKSLLTPAPIPAPEPQTVPQAQPVAQVDMVRVSRSNSSPDR